MYQKILVQVKKNFTTNYINDNTQGPIASISAGPGAITRVYINNNNNKQINLLGHKYLSPYFTVKNGYVLLNKFNKKLPMDEKKRNDLLGYCQIGYHKNIEVTSRNYYSYYEKLKDKNQIIDQVCCAAINMKNINNQLNDQNYSKCKFLLNAAYEGTYFCAIKNKRKKIFLTLIGGGVFQNPLNLIYESILKAHLKYSKNKMSKIERVYIILYNASDEYKPFYTLLKKNNIPFFVN